VEVFAAPAVGDVEVFVHVFKGTVPGM
jgi:hypothetical protein